MNQIVIFALSLMMYFNCISVAVAEQVADISLGKVRMRNLTKLDKKARIDVAAIADKIKKNCSTGAVKVKGDFPNASNAKDYLSKSLFLANEVETYLKTLLPITCQVFVTASRYSGTKLSRENSVELIFYGHQLQLDEMDVVGFSKESSAPSELTEAEVPVEQSKPEQTVDGSLLSAPREEAVIRETASKRERDKRGTEDAALAEALVKKAKSRALEKQKRRASED